MNFMSSFLSEFIIHQLSIRLDDPQNIAIQKAVTNNYLRTTFEMPKKGELYEAYK